MLVTFRHRHVPALLIGLVLLATLFAVPGRAARAANPPPNPTDGQISGAQQQKAALADEVGQLGARVAAMQTQLRQLEAAQELAEQKFVYALSKLQQATADSVLAAKAVDVAQANVDAAQLQFRNFVQATYMSGDVGGTTGALLTAADPNVVLQQSALLNYESSHQLDAIGNLKTATVTKSNVDARARLAVLREKAAKDVAAQAKKDADAAVIAAQARKKQLDASLAADQAALQAAQLQLATLNNQRAVFVAYQQEQARLRAIALAKKRAAEAAARAAAAAEQRREAAAASARRSQQNGDGSSGGGGGGGGGGSSPAPTPSGGSWSPQAGQQAVDRAMRYLGWMYAWAGGNASGPTYGVCAGDGAFNDCHINGFDCSGLTIYAWANYLSMPHYAAAQYGSAGSYHPSLSNLRNGDLLFWSSNGSVSGIHHVAIYVGGGNVIQAPQSGSVIQITPVGSVSWGYYGATRPLT